VSDGPGARAAPGDDPGAPTTERTAVAVVLGGPSAEHDVSVVSGRAIAAGLSTLGHPVEGWLVGLDGSWRRLPAAALDMALPPAAYDDPAALGAGEPRVAWDALGELASRVPPPVVFPALHGPFGEDGTIQALCEAAGLVYAGSRVAASAIGMDKSLFKRLVSGLGMPVVPWMDVFAAEVAADRGAALEGIAAFALALPDQRLMVKPARLGSSVGMTIVRRPADPGELVAALDEAFRFDDRALVEAYLDHPRELEAAVLGNGPADLAVHGPGEIFPGHEFYDYTAKYSEGVSRTTATPDVAPDVRSRIHSIARAAYLAIGAEGFARVDFLLGRTGSWRGELLLSEINTIPGFTPISLFPMVCGAAGLDFPALCGRIVELALERARRLPSGRLTRADLP
jgi:D-alanine-D-alanine ligase